MAVDTLQRSTVAETLKRLVAIAAEVYGVPPAALGPNAGSKGNGSEIAVRLEARYAVIHIATKRLIGTRREILDAMELSPKRYPIVSATEQRFARRIIGDRDVARTIARIERRLDGQPDRVLLAPTNGGYGPRGVSASRLKELYRCGWTARRLATQWGMSEVEIEQIVGGGRS